MDANSLVLNIQPEEGISISLPRQAAGAGDAPEDRDTWISVIWSVWRRERSAYATLLNDCMRGDATLFDRADGVEAAWALVDPILKAWQRVRSPSVPNYAAGSWGPREADELLERDGRHWRQTLTLCRERFFRAFVSAAIAAEVARTAARRFVDWAWQSIARDGQFHRRALGRVARRESLYRLLATPEYRSAGGLAARASVLGRRARRASGSSRKQLRNDAARASAARSHPAAKRPPHGGRSVQTSAARRTIMRKLLREVLYTGRSGLSAISSGPAGDGRRRAYGVALSRIADCAARPRVGSARRR